MYGNKHFSFKLVQIVVLTLNLLIHCTVGNDVEALVSKNNSNASCIESIVCIFLMSPTHAGEMTLTFGRPFCNFFNEIEKKVFQENVKGIMEEIGGPTLKLLRHPSEKEKSRELNEDLRFLPLLNEEKLNALLVERFMKIKERLTTDGFISAAVNDIEPRGSSTKFVRKSIIFSYHPFNWSLRYFIDFPYILSHRRYLSEPYVLLQSSESKGKKYLALCRNNVPSDIDFSREIFEMPSLKVFVSLYFQKDEPFTVCPYETYVYLRDKIKDVIKRSEASIMEILIVKPLNQEYLMKIQKRLFLAIKEIMKSYGLFKAAIDDIKFRNVQLTTYPFSVEAYSNDPFEWSLDISWAPPGQILEFRLVA